MSLHLDFETRSAINLKEVGPWVYAAHPSTEILCFAWGEKEDDVGLRLRGDLDHAEDMARVLETPYIVAHNAHFEYAIYHLILHRRFGWPALWDPQHWDCTMSRAMACRLPGKLEEVCRVLRLADQKDAEGARLMKRLCDAENPEPTPAELKRLGEYCVKDVLAEMGVDRAVPRLSADEKRVWGCDLEINRRGIAIDVDLAENAIKLVAPLMKDLHAKTDELTGGRVEKATQTARIKQFIHSVWEVSPPQPNSLEDELGLSEGGMYFDSIDKANIAAILTRDDVPPRVEELLRLRLKANKSSTSKYTKAARLVETVEDNRARGLLQYHAAGTGRWGGRLLQPQNFTKGSKGAEQTEAVANIKAGDPFHFKNVYGDESVTVLSDALRGLFVAGPGKILAAADYNAIEARVIFWLANDQNALDTYRRGESPYVDMARYIYKDETITKKSHPEEYDIGKRSILGAGFGMGWKRFKVSCWEQGEKIVSDELARMAIDGYREKYEKVKRLWYTTQNAAMTAIRLPGTTQYSAGDGVAWLVENVRGRPYLICTLPSGRRLFYSNPHIDVVETEFGPRDEIHFWGVDSKTKRWARLKTYGGSLVENVTQATARDIMAHAMLNVSAAEALDIVLTVHDELVVEMPVQNADLDRLIKLMCDLPKWAVGLPVKAEGWIGERYHK